MSCNCNCSSSQVSDTQPQGVSRRSVVTGATAGAAVLGLSACGSSSEEKNASLTEIQEIPEPVDMAATSEVPVGGALKATQGKLTVILTQPEEGVFKAFSSACTHQGCQVNVQNTLIACPCHASHFKIEDGSVMGGPAPSPLPQYTVEVKDDRIFVS